MKATLEFDLPEDREEHEDALNGTKYKGQLDEVWNQVFRPHRKHGYSNQELQKLIDDNFEIADKIIEGLIDIYLEVVRED